MSVYERLAERVKVPHCPYAPSVRQAAFLFCDELGIDEVLFGGAARGGKSYALLMSALRYVDRPKYSALILRKTYQDLAKPGAILDDAKSWLVGQPGVAWNEQSKTFRFASGSTLSFGFLQTPNDHLQYRGAAFQFVGFDELTTFPRESQYEFLFSRLVRPLGSDLPIRMRATTNPGGIGHDWVKKRFIDTPHPDRAFVPSRLVDNAHVDATAYRRSLSKLGEVERARLEDGNWYVINEGLVYPTLIDCVVNALPEPARDARRVGGIDWGFNNPFAALWGWLDHDDVLWLDSERYGSGISTDEHAEEIPANVDWFADPAGADQIMTARRHGRNVVKAPNAIAWGIGLVVQRIKSGRLRISHRCTNLIAESGKYRWPDDAKPTDVPVDRDNHALGALRYLIASLDGGEYEIEMY